MQSILETPNIYEKIKYIEDSVHKGLMGWIDTVPRHPARDLEVLNVRAHPPKKGLSYKEGQARLLHDLANIELQAMELGLRTLIEFKDTPKDFKNELSEIILSESRHLQLCLNGLDKLGFKWGDWPCHIALWDSTSDEDSILDRILIVHRYLEGSGIDAAEIILNKLSSTHAPECSEVVKTILDEEIGHVLFGSIWYKKMCSQLEINPEIDFKDRLSKIMFRVPKRLEKMNIELRKKSGFEDHELAALEAFQKKQLHISQGLTPIS